MLELPEMEVLRKDLEKEVVGKRIKDVTVRSVSVVRPFHRNRPDLERALVGHKILAARRRGSVLFLDLDQDQCWVIDPGNAGSLHRQTATDPLSDDTHIAATFTIGGALHVSEPGKETTMRTGVVPLEDAYQAAGISPDAIDLLDDNPTWMEFGEFLVHANRPLKLLLIDPQYFVGIGPVYSDEILWEAGLRYDHPSATLSPQEVRRLYRATQEVMIAAMKAAGSGLDEQDVEPMVDEDGEAAQHLRVYGREGAPCPRCRRPIIRKRLRTGVFSYHCEQCMI